MGYYKDASVICEEMLDNMDDKYAKAKGYWLWEIFKAISCALSDMSQELDEVRSKLFCDSLQGDELDDYVQNWSYIVRKKMTQAVGYAQFTAKEDGGGTITQGTYIATDERFYYITTEAATVAAGATVSVPIAAAEYGAAGNCGSGDITQIITNVSFLESVTNIDPITGGQDEESDDELRGRYYEAMKKAANAGNRAFYVEKAKTVEGVAQAYCEACPDNVPGTVDVYVLDVNGNQVTAEVLAAVQNLLDPNRNGDGSGEAPIGAVCTVKNPIRFEVDIKAEFTLAAGYTEAGVTPEMRERLSEYLQGCFESGSVKYSQIMRVLCECGGVEDVRGLLVNGSTRNQSVSEPAVFVLGTIEFL